MNTNITDKNVLGEPLQLCCSDPETGFYRNGYCQTGDQDVGVHVACAQVTDEFLQYSRERGNDLITPRPEFDFPGLKDGDGWCLCAARWMEAYEAGVAPPLNLAATHEKMLEFVPLEILQKYDVNAQVSAAPQMSAPKMSVVGAHQFAFDGLQGGEIALSDFAGRPVLVVNTASECGLTGQYTDLQTLYETYKDRGLVVLGVPSNDFGNQEPGSAAEISAFVDEKFGITFPMTEKYAVKGDAAHPFYNWAAAEKKGGLLFSSPKWNFHKYLIDGQGNLVKSFGSQVSPGSAKILDEIEKLL